jgi:hypothetical protein
MIPTLFIRIPAVLLDLKTWPLDNDYNTRRALHHQTCRLQHQSCTTTVDEDYNNSTARPLLPLNLEYKACQLDLVLD